MVEMAEQEQEQEQEQVRGSRAFRRLLRSCHLTGSYGPVLVMIVVTYALATTLSRRWGVTILLFAQMATVWLALRISVARRGFRLAVGGLFIVTAVAAVVNLLTDGGSHFVALVFTPASILYLVAPFSIVRRIGYRQKVDAETMLGALAAYLFIGMAFAFAYRFIGAVQTAPFFGSRGDGTVSQDLFFSFVTLTTTGYGDLVPAGNPGQSLAVLEALTGQLFLVTAVTKIVSAWRPRSWPGPRPDAEQTPDRPDQ